MSDGEKPGSSDRKWDLSNPQTLLAVVGIVVSIVGSIFGVALAMPTGQDILCKNFGMSCKHVSMLEAQLNFSVIDFDAWCDNWLKEMEANPPPPPGFSGIRSDCVLDASETGPRGFTKQIALTRIEGDEKNESHDGWARKSPGSVLIAHLSIKHTKTRVETPFTIQADCWRHNPEDSAWEHLNGCALSPAAYRLDGYAGSIEESFRQTYEKPEASQQPNGTTAQVMAENEVDFIQRWRLDIEGSKTADLPPGDYRIELSAGEPGEALEPFLLRAWFSVVNEPPPVAPMPAPESGPG